MKIRPIIEGPCVIVPAAPVLDRLSDAGGTRLKVLLYILANGEFDPATAADILNITEKSFNHAIEYWQKAGAILLEEGEIKKPQKPSQPEKKEEPKDSAGRTVVRAQSLPRYSADEVASFVEENNLSDFLAMCQQYMGKMFNIAETETVVGLLDYLKLEPEYVLLLFAHCEKMNKKSLRYVEKLAIGLFDDGIMGYEELDSHLAAIEAAAQMDKPLRKLFGLGRRALLPKEKAAFENWVGRWNLPLAMIEKAYQITVENTGNASVAYCNAVLERWHAEGYTTVEQVERAMEEYRHDKAGVRDKKGSFETDDFFEAALRRSYEDEEG